MSAPVQRAAAYAALCLLALVVPLGGATAAATVGAVVLIAAVAVTDGPLFDLLAFPGDRESGRLVGLVTLVIAAAIVSVLTLRAGMPSPIFVGTLFLVGGAGFAAVLSRHWTDSVFVEAMAYCLGGSTAATLGLVIGSTLEGIPIVLPSMGFLAIVGSLYAAILVAHRLPYEEALTILAVAPLLWLLWSLEPSLAASELGIALVVTGALGGAAYVLETASPTGMLTGILLGLLTIVLGGYGWFAILISFFVIGGLATKFGYETKEERGVAEANAGARGSGNVLGNSAAATAAVLAYSASAVHPVPVDPSLFLLAFLGAVSTAMSDTLSSEIGSVFDNPRLVTTIEPVPPGTDGGVTWQGTLAGIVGAAIVGGGAFLLFDVVTPVGAGIVIAAGFVGMTVDSILGATLEGPVLRNQGVNFVATLAGAIVAAGVTLSL